MLSLIQDTLVCCECQIFGPLVRVLKVFDAVFGDVKANGWMNMVEFLEESFSDETHADNADRAGSDGRRRVNRRD